MKLTGTIIFCDQDGVHVSACAATERDGEIAFDFEMLGYRYSATVSKQLDGYAGQFARKNEPTTGPVTCELSTNGEKRALIGNWVEDGQNLIGSRGLRRRKSDVLEGPRPKSSNKVVTRIRTRGKV
jgi:hypothetical protein